MICQRCSDVETSEEGKERLAEFAKQINVLFEVQPDIDCATAPNGQYAQTIGIGVSEKDERIALNALLGPILERFHRTFGEHPTKRKMWWRERPVMFSQMNYYNRQTLRGLWMRLVIEKITADEEAGLAVLAASESITFPPISSGVI